MSEFKSRSVSELYSLNTEFAKAVARYADDISIGQKLEFTCPLCGGDAIVGKAAYNGHIYAYCDCGATMVK